MYFTSQRKACLFYGVLFPNPLVYGQLPCTTRMKFTLAQPGTMGRPPNLAPHLP